MSLQDDIFDVQDALKGSTEEESFERIYDRIAKYERWIEEAKPKLRAIAEFKRLLTTDPRAQGSETIGDKQ